MNRRSFVKSLAAIVVLGPTVTKADTVVPCCPVDPEYAKKAMEHAKAMELAMRFGECVSVQRVTHGMTIARSLSPKV